MAAARARGGACARVPPTRVPPPSPWPRPTRPPRRRGGGGRAGVCVMSRRLTARVPTKKRAPSRRRRRRRRPSSVLGTDPPEWLALHTFKPPLIRSSHSGCCAFEPLDVWPSAARDATAAAAGADSGAAAVPTADGRRAAADDDGKQARTDHGTLPSACRWAAAPGRCGRGGRPADWDGPAHGGGRGGRHGVPGCSCGMQCA